VKIHETACAALVALVLPACTTASGESPGFMQSMQQVIGAASMAVGLRAGDSSMAQKGADMFGQGLGASPSGAMTNSQPGSTEPPTHVAQGGGQDRQAIANQCSQRAQSRYNRQAQNVLLQQSACIYHCAWVATSDPQYQRLYVQSQQNANSLCSMSVGNSCNNIDTGYCRP